MHEVDRVYELNADGIVSDLLNLLSERGNNVVEQAPAGVWWFQTDKEMKTVEQEIVDAFACLVARDLREIHQEG
ncbi:MAG: hypothetical protein ACR2JC_02660 [Chloroflexota bacterium]|nr:MAG: hypothetical protein DLM70_01130 [Chloroflexota bacterium]